MQKDRLPDDLIRKLKDTAKKKIPTEDVLLSAERQEYRTLILSVHANIENLLSLLIVAYFTKHDVNEEMFNQLDIILEHIDYGTKLNILKGFDFEKNKRNRKTLSKALEITKYRNAVVHLKRRESKRLPLEENIKLIKKLGEDLEEELILAICSTDVRMFEPTRNALKEYLNEFQQKIYDDLKKEEMKKKLEQS